MSQEEALKQFIQTVRRCAPVLVEGEIAEIIQAFNEALANLGYEFD